MSFFDFCGGISLPFSEDVFVAALNNVSFFEKYGFSIRQSDDEFWIFSNCGLYELMIDFEDDNQCEPNDAATVIEKTILSSDIYKYVLKDVSFGRFSKSELYWTYYIRFVLSSRITTKKKYDFDDSFRLFSFETDFSKEKGCVYYHIDGLDEYNSEIEIKRMIDVDLDAAVRILAIDVMSIGDSAQPDMSIFDSESEYNNEDIAIVFSYDQKADVHIPTTEDELFALYRELVYDF